jgi:hypothetical protein
VSQFLLDWIQYAELIIFWLGIVAPAVTALFWRWWSSVWGWTICGLEICISGLLLQASLEQMFGLVLTVFSTAWLWLDAVLISCVGLIIVWRTIVIFQTQRSGLDEDVPRRQSQPENRPNGAV